MLQFLLDRLDPWPLCDRGMAFSGNIALSHFDRLALHLDNRDGNIYASLSFGRDARRRASVTGQVKGELQLTCQRCMEAVNFPINIDVALVFTQGPEESAQIPQDLDYAIISSGEHLVLRDLIEDELLLAIPETPRHEHRDCIDLDSMGVSREVAKEPDAEQKDNPFAILGTLKSK